MVDGQGAAGRIGDWISIGASVLLAIIVIGIARKRLVGGSAARLGRWETRRAGMDAGGSAFETLLVPVLFGFGLESIGLSPALAAESAEIGVSWVGGALRMPVSPLSAPAAPST